MLALGHLRNWRGWISPISPTINVNCLALKHLPMQLSANGVKGRSNLTFHYFCIRCMICSFDVPNVILPIHGPSSELWHQWCWRSSILLLPNIVPRYNNCFCELFSSYIDISPRFLVRKVGVNRGDFWCFVYSDGHKHCYGCYWSDSWTEGCPWNQLPRVSTPPHIKWIMIGFATYDLFY